MPSAATPSEVKVAPWTSSGLYQRTASGDGLRKATERPPKVREGDATSNAQFSAPGVRMSARPLAGLRSTRRPAPSAETDARSEPNRTRFVHLHPSLRS